MLRKYWIGILAVIVALMMLGITVFYHDHIVQANNLFEAITVGLGWVLFFVQYLYSKSEAIYLAINNFRLRSTNETTKWNFTIDLNNCEDPRPLEKIWAVVGKHNRQATKWHSNNSSLIINMPGFTLRAFISSSPATDEIFDSAETVCVQVSNLELPYRTFEAKIEKEIIPLIQDIVQVIKPHDGKYVAKIAFTSANPYFGFFVRKLNLPNVVSFNCDLIETSVGGHKNNVTVTKDHLEIIAEDLHALQVLSKKYITLSWGKDYASQGISIL